MAKLIPRRRVPRGGRPDQDDPWRRMRLSLGLLAAVVAIGTLGYVLLGLGPLDAVYQTVTTVGTVGFREVGEATGAWKVFTIVLILTGVGVMLYTLTVLLEVIVEGRLTDHLWRRRMERDIAAMADHVVVAGCGRLGRAIATAVDNAGRAVVVVDRDVDRLQALGLPFVPGDATDDEVLAAAGVDRAASLIAALTTDADNLYVTLSARSRRPDLFIIARARQETAEPKLRQAGADRVVNPQFLGGTRAAAMALQPNVADFLDVVMHDGSLEFRLAEVVVGERSPVAGQDLRSSQLRDRTGAMVLALRDPDGDFLTNPPPEAEIRPGHVLIAIGTTEQLAALEAIVSGRG
ncbi:MAG: potassium channel protein [Acidimicrobiales bacterium]